MPTNSTHFIGPSATACMIAGFCATSIAMMPVQATPSAM